MIATQKQKVKIIHQCAWCKRLMIEGARIEDIPGFVPDSHGICLVCMAAMEMHIIDSYDGE